jgi:hypothetical protein
LKIIEFQNCSNLKNVQTKNCSNQKNLERDGGGGWGSGDKERS